MQQQKHVLYYYFFIVSKSSTVSLKLSTSISETIYSQNPFPEWIHSSSSSLNTHFHSAKSYLSFPPVRAMKTMQGGVVCATNDKTISVEVVRLDPHPKYKRRVKKKKKFQAHDPENQFIVGDYVQLERSRTISKTKSFLTVAIPARTSNKKTGEESNDAVTALGIPLESEQQQKETFKCFVLVVLLFICCGFVML